MSRGEYRISSPRSEISFAEAFVMVDATSITSPAAVDRSVFRLIRPIPKILSPMMWIAIQTPLIFHSHLLDCD